MNFLIDLVIFGHIWSCLVIYGHIWSYIVINFGHTFWSYIFFFTNLLYNFFQKRWVGVKGSLENLFYHRCLLFGDLIQVESAWPDPIWGHTRAVRGHNKTCLAWLPVRLPYYPHRHLSLYTAWFYWRLQRIPRDPIKFSPKVLQPSCPPIPPPQPPTSHCTLLDSTRYHSTFIGTDFNMQPHQSLWCY